MIFVRLFVVSSKLNNTGWNIGKTQPKDDGG